MQAAALAPVTRAAPVAAAAPVRREAARRERDDEPLAPAACPACGTAHGHDFGRIAVHERAPSAPQAQLAVGPADDRFEREADAVAERVMRATIAAGPVQCSDCAATDDRTVRRQAESPYRPEDGVVTPLAGRGEDELPAAPVQAKPAPGAPVPIAPRRGQCDPGLARRRCAVAGRRARLHGSALLSVRGLPMATHAFPLDRPARSDARASSRHASLTRGAVTATALPSLDRTSAQVTPAASRTELAASSRLQYDFSRMCVHEAKPPPGAGESVRKLLDRAYTESATPLPAALQTALGDRAAADFSDVRVHAGASSAAAAERLGARAYTLGRDVHLGHDAQSLAGSDRERLLAHEAVHAAQQGASPVRPHDGLQLGRPDSAAETEASSIAASLCAQGGSPSLALRDRLRGPPMALRQKVDPQIQRDLKGPYKAIDGTFNLNLKTESHAGAKNGMSGTIKFKASDVAPDAAQIRLLQIARDEDLTTGKEYEWTGDEANRMKVMTAADKGVDPGFFVDAIHKNRTPRTAKTDAPVSPYYIDDYKALADPNNADGSKKGKAISEASLWDYPGSSGNRRFTFETAAQNPANGYVYATLSWGFTIRDASKGKVESEHAAVNDFPTGTFGAAVKSFNEFYKNPGSSKAPT